MLPKNLDRASSPGYAATSKAPPSVPATPGEHTNGDDPAKNLGFQPAHAPPSISPPRIPKRALERWAPPPSVAPIRHINVDQRQGHHPHRTTARSGWACQIHRHNRHSSPAKHRLTSPAPQSEVSNVPSPGEPWFQGLVGGPLATIVAHRARNYPFQMMGGRVPLGGVWPRSSGRESKSHTSVPPPPSRGRPPAKDPGPMLAAPACRRLPPMTWLLLMLVRNVDLPRDIVERGRRERCAIQKDNRNHVPSGRPRPSKRTEDNPSGVTR